MTDYRVGVDIGGTFTDIVFMDDAGNILVKNPNCAYVVGLTADDTARCQTHILPVVQELPDGSLEGLGEIWILYRNYDDDLGLRKLTLNG